MICLMMDHSYDMRVGVCDKMTGRELRHLFLSMKGWYANSKVSKGLTKRKRAMAVRMLTSFWGLAARRKASEIKTASTHPEIIATTRLRAP